MEKERKFAIFKIQDLTPCPFPCDLDTLIEVLTAAYKKRVMNKTKIKEDKMDEFLKAAETGSPMGILKKLRELESKGS